MTGPFRFRGNIIFFYERRVIHHGENHKEHNRVQGVSR